MMDMKKSAIVAAAFLALCGCSDNTSLPATAWTPTMENPPLREVKEGKPMTEGHGQEGLDL